jgi:hypothetical protein
VVQIYSLINYFDKIHIAYENMDGMEPYAWRSYISIYTGNSKDFRSYHSVSSTKERAVCEAWLIAFGGGKYE